MSAVLPWEIHPDLTEERLTLAASWIAQGRHDAVYTHNKDIGGNAWTLGTCAYAYGMFRVTQAYESGNYDWLGIVDSSNQFVFRIGSVPVRYYRGPGEEPTARTLRRANSELKQMSLMLDEGEGRGDLLYRFAIDTDLEGDVASITFVGLNGESAECYWEVPLTGSVATIHTLDMPLAEGVELPAPMVGVPGEDKKKDGTSDS